MFVFMCFFLSFELVSLIVFRYKHVEIMSLFTHTNEISYVLNLCLLCIYRYYDNERNLVA